MKHPSEEQLILYHYGDAENGAAIRSHLESCDVCRTEYAALRQTFAAVEALPVPERNEVYGREVWAQLRPRLEPASGKWWGWLQLRRWALLATMVAVLTAGILIGRLSGPVGPNGGPTAQQIRERVLLVAVGDHLEQSQMVLIELVNLQGNGRLNIEAEQEWARDLIADNRLYQQTASLTGDAALSDLLEELEQVLLEIAHSPSEIQSQEFKQLREQIEEQGILFKIRVVSSQVREREETGWQEPASLDSRS